MQTNIVGTLILLLYLCVMLCIGWYTSTRIKSNTDFVVAGRALGPWMIAGTLTVTEIGGGSSLGVVQQGMEEYGIRGAWYIVAMGIAYAILSLWAPKVRRSNVKTTPEYFRRRYGSGAGIIQAVLTILSQVGDTVAQYVVSATIISVMLRIDFQMALIIAAVVVTTYSVMGGLWSVSVTDFVQMFLIFVGMFTAIPYALRLAGGWQQVVLHVPPGTFEFYQKGDGVYLFSLVVMYFTSFASNQVTLSRIYAAKSPLAARQGTLFAAGLNLLYAFIPPVLGIIVLALINMGTFGVDSFAHLGPHYALPVLAMGHMPAVAAGLLFVGVVSATMSTIDSALLASGSVFGVDVYKKHLRANASDQQVLTAVKVVMVVVSVFSFVVALFNTAGILQLIRFSFTLKAATAFVPYLVGHYWKRASQAGAIASMLGGAITVLVLDLACPSALAMPTIFPALAASGICFVVFSLLAPPRKYTLALVPEEDALTDKEL